MDRLQREILRIAEEEGLKVLGVSHRGKHRFIVVTNKLGWTLRQPLHAGNKIKDVNMRNQRADFRRFSRGSDHNLSFVEK